MDALREEIRQLVEGKDCRVIQDIDSDLGHLVVKARMLRAPSPLCSIYIGEALYQFRSALDHLICCLTEENGEVVHNKREFPIFDNRDKFRDPVSGDLMPGIKLRIDGLKTKHRALVEGEQPFQRKYGTAHDDPLWLLYCL
ncbi:MAG TPA: hypothetical protein VM013_08705, partial [Dehalococcoidia bacterium]|nr:hypothetical protein [Dehalococcoidia bacterium]